MDKIKIIKRVMKKFIYIFLLFLIITLMFVYINRKIYIEKNNTETISKLNENIPIPDRIIYKNKEGKYIIANYDEISFQSIFNELYKLTNNIKEGNKLSEDEITRLQEESQFVEFDYNTISKNYVFLLKNDKIGLIKRTNDGGIILTDAFPKSNEIIKIIEKATKKLSKYDFDKTKSYTQKTNKSIDDYPHFLQLEEVERGVYQKVLTNSLSIYNQIIKYFNLSDLKDISEYTTLYENIIITLSEYEIKDVKQNIGNIKYEFSNKSEEFYINITFASKVVNTNCIYYIYDEKILEELSNENLNQSNDDYAVPYYLKNNKLIATYNNSVVELISIEQACDIADKEAQKSKYQYQPWESVFLSRYNNDIKNASIELVSDLSNIGKSYYWNDAWKIMDYKNTLMWRVRLFDENDPLTALYIYINALTGEVIGAGCQSD